MGAWVYNLADVVAYSEIHWDFKNAADSEQATIQPRSVFAGADVPSGVSAFVFGAFAGCVWLAFLAYNECGGISCRRCADISILDNIFLCEQKTRAVPENGALQHSNANAGERDQDDGCPELDEHQ